MEPRLYRLNTALETLGCRAVVNRLYTKRGKASVTLGVASSVANDVIMRIACFVAAGIGRRHGDCRHGPALVVNDVIIRMTS